MTTYRMSRKVPAFRELALCQRKQQGNKGEYMYAEIERHYSTRCIGVFRIWLQTTEILSG